MAEIEIEAKFRLTGEADQAARLAQKLRQLDARLVRACHLEDNHLLDFHDGMLRFKGCGLRVRITPGKCTFTFKGQRHPDDRYKIREELEVDVTDGVKLLAMLRVSAYFRNRTRLSTKYGYASCQRCW